MLLASCAAFDFGGVSGAAERNGIELTATLRGALDALVVDVTVRNQGDTDAFLVPDQCGRITEARLVRTDFEPEGLDWDGSIQAAKELVLLDQASRQAPDRFHPKLAGSLTGEIPACTRLSAPYRLAAGSTVSERWELPYSLAQALRAVGSADTLVRVELVEAEAHDRSEFLDILSGDEVDQARAGRNARVELATSAVLDHPPTGGDRGPSRGELFDRLLDHEALRAWVGAQRADGWRLAELTPFSPYVGTPENEQVRLKLVNTAYTRAASATARADGSGVAATLPGEDDRRTPFERRPATSPPGIGVISSNFELGDDVLIGSVHLPSGRLVVGEYLYDLAPLAVDIEPGQYPVHATLARYEGRDWQDVSLATLVVSDSPPVRWEQAGQFAVDGGSASFVSAEGQDLLRQLQDRDDDADAVRQGEWWALNERIFDSLAAHDFVATNYTLEPGINLVQFSSGWGDGVYPIFVGSDAAGRPAQVVVDFYLLRLDWPE